MTEEGVLTRTIERDGVVVEGPDARSWLQGQITQDLENMGAGESRLSLVLSPQGKVDSLCRVTLVGPDRLLLDVERGFGDLLSTRLARFKLRVKVTLARVSVLCEERAGEGFDSLGPPSILTEDVSETASGVSEPVRDGPAVDDPFEGARIIAGVPRLGRELTDRTIPQEAGNELIDRTVSFTKGCFTGQELVARLDARGANVPRRIRLIRGQVTHAPASGSQTEVIVPLAGDRIEIEGVEAGQLTSVARLGGRWVGLGLVKRAAISDGMVEALVTDEQGNRFPATVSVPESPRQHR
ncbi:MAG: CAF17-like 4Fe-4S cluster assembly/insertion protein YgfZ [Acidimicrobiales bacterium]